MAKLFEVEPHIRSMIDSDGAVLLDLRAGKYYSLNGVAAQVWIKAEAGSSRDDVLTHLQALYDIDRETLQGDIRQFLSGLQQKGLIRVSQ